MHRRSTQRPHILRRLLLLSASFGIGAIVWILLGESENLIAAEGSEQKIMARIGQETLTRSEVHRLAAGELIKLHLFSGEPELQIERQRHNLIAGTARTQIHVTLLDREAAKRGVSRDTLLDTEVKAKVEAVTDDDIGRFYSAQRGRIRGSRAQAEPQIRQYLERQKLEEAYDQFIKDLEERYDVEYHIEPFRVSLQGDGPSQGKAEAPITIVEFSDFECPFCNRVSPTLDKVKETYGDKVRIVFRQFPLQIHPNAAKAGEASLCANEQGKFWEMHDLMFADNRNLGVEALKSKASTIDGLDSDAFDACLDDARFAEAVKSDIAEGTRVGVSSTPSFFINGRFLSGARPYEDFSEIIDEELERQGVS